MLKRKVFKFGNSKVLTLPKDWGVKEGENVFIIFDDLLLVIPETLKPKGEKVTELLIQAMTNSKRAPIKEKDVKNRNNLKGEIHE